MQLAVRACCPLRANLVEHEQSGALRTDFRVGERCRSPQPSWRASHLRTRKFFQTAPELIFETDAGLVPIKNDGAFDYSRFHERLLWIGTSYLWFDAIEGQPTTLSK